MRCKRVVFVVLSAVALAFLLPAVALAQPPIPSFPAFYSGTVVTEAGDAVPDGTEVYAMVQDYQSPSVTAANGSYEKLKVAPPRTYKDQAVTFYVDVDGAGPVEAVAATADVTVNFVEWLNVTVNLTYTPPDLPAAGIPALPTIMMWLGIGGGFALVVGVFIWRRSRQVATNEILV